MTEMKSTTGMRLRDGRIMSLDDRFTKGEMLQSGGTVQNTEKKEHRQRNFCRNQDAALYSTNPWTTG
jgi:hypothetical protein